MRREKSCHFPGDEYMRHKYHYISKETQAESWGLFQ